MGSHARPEGRESTSAPGGGPSCGYAGSHLGDLQPQRFPGRPQTRGRLLRIPERGRHTIHTDRDRRPSSATSSADSI